MRDRREAKVGDALIRMLNDKGSFKGVVIIGDEVKFRDEDASADELWRRLHDAAAKCNPKYFGFDEARARFLRFFPDGFQSERYCEYERDYKLAAKAKLDIVPPERAADGSGFGETIMSAFQATNLLSQFENMRIRDALRSPAADDFIRAAARFTLGEGKPALLAMERALKPHDAAKWTIVTYLPYLWRPDTHMFLKPEVTVEFAARVGHRFANDYDSRLDIAVYNSLRDLAAKTEDEVAGLNPRDWIDVQSFIWTVGRYKETDQPAA